MEKKKALFIFTDSSANKGKNQVGIGMVFCQAFYQGNSFWVQEKVLEKGELHRGDRSSYAERLAIFRGLIIARDLGYKDVFIFNDHLSVVKKINSRIIEQDDKTSEIEEKIIKLSHEFQYLKIGYIKKRKNSQAHKLSRKAMAGLLSHV